MITVQIPRPAQVQEHAYNTRSLLVELVVAELLEILNAPSSADKTESIETLTVSDLISRSMDKIAKKLA